jgi:hypothetical protein
MDVFGLTGVQAIIVIAIAGVVLQNVVGWLKGSTPFDIRQAAASGIIAFIMAIIIVGPQVEAIPDDFTEELKLIFFIGLIGQIAGFDILAKNGVKAIVGKIKSKKQE